MFAKSRRLWLRVLTFVVLLFVLLLSFVGAAFLRHRSEKKITDGNGTATTEFFVRESPDNAESGFLNDYEAYRESFFSDPQDNFEPERLKYVYREPQYEGQVLTLKYQDLKYSLRLGRYAHSRRVAFSHGSKQSPEGGSGEILKLIAVEQGFGFKTALNYCFDGLIRDTESWLTSFVDRPPENAELRFTPDGREKFVLVEHREGRLTDREKLYKDIYDAVLTSKDASLTISAKTLEPSVTTEELEKQTTLRSRFSTSFSGSSADRAGNIALAFSLINGTVLEPGETFSFNKTVGPRTEARGFGTSKIILNGKFEDGVGGGVCQASTTLYNAALLSDMYINSAHGHSLSVSYVEPSFDAMVSLGTGDLEFTNRGDHPVYIRTYTHSGRATAEIYGTKLPYIIKRRSYTVKRTPPPKDKIVIDVKKEHTDLVRYSDEAKYHTYPKDSVQSRGYLQYYNSKGKLIREELIRRNTYKSQQGILIKGTEQRPAENLPHHFFPEDNYGGFPFWNENYNLIH
jgi:vancomycin resistance protein YoaR